MVDNFFEASDSVNAKPGSPQGKLQRLEHLSPQSKSSEKSFDRSSDSGLMLKLNSAQSFSEDSDHSGEGLRNKKLVISQKSNSISPRNGFCISNKFELFEEFLSFLDSDSDLNSVLSAYWANLFRVLVGSNARDVFQYIFTHQEVISKLVKHIYQPSICEVV